MLTTDGGSVSGWPMIAKKRGSIQDGKTLCCDDMNGRSKSK